MGSGNDARQVEMAANQLAQMAGDRFRAQRAILEDAGFPIFGLVDVSGPRPFLASIDSTTRPPRSVQRDDPTTARLVYGSPGGPRVYVLTTIEEAGVRDTPLALLRALFARPPTGPMPLGGLDHLPPAPAEAPFGAPLVVDGVVHLAVGYQADRAWALELDLELDGNALSVTIAARDVAASAVELVRVSEFEPFFASLTDRLKPGIAQQLAAARSQDWELPPSEGLDAHRALAQLKLNRRQAQKVSPRHARSVGPTEMDPRQDQIAWESAVRAQMSLQGQSRQEAVVEVGSAMRQLERLTELAWFTDPKLVERAVEETLRRVALGVGVASEPAQEAWKHVRPAARGRLIAKEWS